MNWCAAPAGWTVELSNCQPVRKNASSTYRSRQSCHCGRVQFGRNTWSAKTLLTLNTSVRVLYNIPQLLLWRINFTFNNYSMTLYSVWILLVVIHNVVVQGILRLAPPPPPTRPSLWRAATFHVATLLPGPEGVRSWGRYYCTNIICILHQVVHIYSLLLVSHPSVVFCERSRF